MRMIGTILSISSKEDWLYNLGKPLYSSQLCPQTDSLTQCFSCFLCFTGTPVATFWNFLSLSSIFPFLFVFLSGSEPSVGGKGACWESHVPYLNIEGTVYTFHSWAIELVWSSKASGSSAAPNSGNSSFNTSIQEKQECSSQAKPGRLQLRAIFHIQCVARPNTVQRDWVPSFKGMICGLRQAKRTRVRLEKSTNKHAVIALSRSVCSLSKGLCYWAWWNTWKHLLTQWFSIGGL